MTNFNDVTTKLYNRPYEEMSLIELYAEASVHNWHKQRMKDCIEKLKKRKWWLEQNRPIIPSEELRRQYEDGEMSGKEYRAAFARRKKAIIDRMAMEDRMKYADIVVTHEEAVVAYLNELKSSLEAKEARNELQRKRRALKAPKDYDPRKKTTKLNYNKTLDPQRHWATRNEFSALPKLQRARARWKDAVRTDSVGTSVQKHMQPIMQWDVDKLRDIARDRGFYTDVAMVGQIAEKLNITLSGAQKLIDTGRLSWSQCIIIGAVLEMTPKEFCDTFMSGYFREVADGVYKAYVEDTDALLDKPYQAKAKETSDAEGQI